MQLYLSRFVIILFAIASGLSVATIYSAQPLLDSMAREFNIDPSSIGMIMTVTQIGYALGLFFIVPLGDLLDRRRLIVSQLSLSALALIVVGTTSSVATLFAGVFAIGLFAVVIQVLVAFAASLAAPEERGQVVGVVTSGIVLGILLGRSIAGALTDLSGWRTVYFVSSIAILLVAGMLYRVLPAQNTAIQTSYPQLLRSVLTLFLEEPILRTRALIGLFIFATFSTLWTPLVLLLSAPPISLSHTAIGLFGLVGLVGAAAAGRSGQWADRGWSQRTTGLGLTLLLVSWLPIAYAGNSLTALILGIILLDFAIQAIHVTNQSMIFAVRPEARSRLVAAYMIFYSIGSGIGAIASTSAYAKSGWMGVSLVGATFSTVALAFWAATSPSVIMSLKCKSPQSCSSPLR